MKYFSQHWVWLNLTYLCVLDNTFYLNYSQGLNAPLKLFISQCILKNHWRVDLWPLKHPCPVTRCLHLNLYSGGFCLCRPWKAAECGSSVGKPGFQVPSPQLQHSSVQAKGIWQQTSSPASLIIFFKSTERLATNS